MKQLILFLFCIAAVNSSFAQLDMIKPAATEKPKTVKPAAAKPAKKITPGKSTRQVTTAAPPKKTYSGTFIIVYRQDKKGDQYGDYSVTVDGKKVGQLNSGQYLRYAVSGGQHNVQVAKTGGELSEQETVTTSSGKNSYVNCLVRRHMRKETLKVAEVRENAGIKAVDRLQQGN